MAVCVPLHRGVFLSAANSGSDNATWTRISRVGVAVAAMVKLFLEY